MADEEQIAILKQGVEVWNKWRKRNPQAVVDLNNIKLDTGLQMSGENTTVDLSGVDLSRARLWFVHIGNINLNKANLSGASLASATLNGVDLSNADLDGADLMFAQLHHVNLQNANLTDVKCLGTGFVDTDLSNARGLETTHHRGPSTISVDTIFQTKPRLPDVFLRGCGVPEILIENLPYMLETAIDFYSCFISYSHADQAFARRVHDTLQGRGIRCWLDEKQMNPGDDIYEEIHRGIRYWDKVLLCCSKSSLGEKWWVDQEINKAFQKERDLMKDRGEKVLALIPLNLDGYLFSPEYTGAKGDEIRSRLTADFTGWEHDNAIFEREIERVIKALRTDGGKEPPPKPKL